MLIFSLGVSLLLGLLLAKVYKYKTIYTKEFVITLSLLPTIISLIIFLVNGNLGTSVAVAGTFSLIRFRSAAGGAKELLAIFIATAIGIATGMGYVSLAVFFTLLLSLALFIFENSSFSQVSQTRRYLTIKLPADFDYELLFEALFSRCCKQQELASIKSIEGNRSLQLEYVVELQPSLSDQDFLKEFLLYEKVKEVSLSKIAKKKKTL
nr:DUF4956 domain-containing protein [Streptococcus oricebi]